MKAKWKRPLALVLALILTAGGLSSAASAAGLSPTCDESYYATLDYYGGLMDSSVVKSYRLNGNSSITDYGAYDSVENLTDGRAPAQWEGGRLTFELGDNAPEKFYFEGKTTRPFRELPWTISVSYKLNGAPVLAENLAGETGLVEIDLDVLPNPAGSQYGKDNMVLTAATAFNDDDILSLEAPGAEVQLVGNLRTVLFMVLPGEEQHFAIRVGSEDFSFSGLMFLAVPATLQQLDKVADLKEAKEKSEDSLDAIDESLDVILGTLEGMSGSLNATANGLDQLNAARRQVSNDKGPVYDKTDLALSDLDALADHLGSLDRCAVTASQAVTDTTAALADLTDTTVSLKPILSDARHLIRKVQTNVEALRKLAVTTEGYNDEELRKLVRELGKDAKSLGTDVDDLTDAMDDLRLALDELRGINTVNASEITGGMKVTVGGKTMTVAEVQEAVRTAKALEKGYQDYAAAVVAGGGAQPSMEDFLQYYVAAQAGLSSWNDVAALPAEQQQALGKKVAEAGDLLTMVSTHKSELEEMDRTLSTTTSALTVLNNRIGQVNAIVRDIAEPTADLLQELQYVCSSFTDGGLTDDLAQLTDICAEVLEEMDAHSGEIPQLLKDLNSAGDLLSRITHKGDEAIDRFQVLDNILNTYEPEAQQGLADLQTLSGSAQSTLHDLSSALSALEGLLRDTGPQLDEGTRQSLEGLSAALRRSTVGLDQTGTIRNAKTTIKDLMDDEWDRHSGEVDSLLNMDANAVCISLTDSRNPSPESVQYIMRTQEIKVEKAEQILPGAVQEADETFWDRVVAMFKGILDAFLGLFKRG